MTEIVAPRIRQRRPIAERNAAKALAGTALAAQAYVCAYCFAPLNRSTMTAEHRIPRSKGGGTHRGNISATCDECNNAKGSMTERDFTFLLVMDLKRPVPTAIHLARFRRRMWLRVHRANERILASVGREYRPNRKWK